jgi:hypothetical protein
MSEMKQRREDRESIDSKKRKLNPADIALPSGYEIEVFWTDLDTPINLIFTKGGDMLVADAGVLTGNGFNFFRL